MQHINLSYSWTPHQAQAEQRDQTSPLRNPLMDMLQAVRATGSIAGAARVLQLSYRHVWGELKRWEQVLAQPLIVWEKGQAARLTEFADKLLWAERQAQARLAPQISALQAELEKTFAVAFDPGSHLLTVYASHDDALVKLREHSARQSLHLDMRFCGSVDAIRALNEGRCTVAGFHAPLQPDVSTLTARTYKPLLKTGQHKLIGFATREQGWMVAPGNPLNITGWNDLNRPELRLVNRTLGTGTRLLLDQWLENQTSSASLPTGYDQEETSHTAVATRIASGQADLGLGIASAARAQQLDFVPLTQEHYWLVCLKSALNNPAVVALRQVLQSAQWQRLLGQQTGYRLHAEAGQIQSLKACLPWWPLPQK
ncbi:substrate-binding domain-containing protein [Limnohabitans sp. DCL3]|uniref:substrate-binding domain-containing protein n=1 Tax=Limnohabitans sp. DCL3 TaxID=3374103 RepID=UPI003A8A9F3B